MVSRFKRIVIRPLIRVQGGEGKPDLGIQQGGEGKNRTASLKFSTHLSVLR